MKLTNLQKFPEPFFRAIEANVYSKGDAHYSATGLIDSPRIVLLKERHGDEIVEDVADLFFAFFGTMAHKVLEEAGADNAFIEERLYWAFGTKEKRMISGATDFVTELVGGKLKITDHKTTSVWTAIYGDRKKDWEEQLNIYAYLYKAHGFDPGELEIFVMYRDWRNGEAKRAELKNEYYPPKAEMISIPLWHYGKQQEFIESKVAALVAAEPLPDAELPECTPEQTWEKPASYAVFKKDGKRAMSGGVKDSEEEAIQMMKEKAGAGGRVEKRPGERTRCEGGYCSVAFACNQFQDWMKWKA